MTDFRALCARMADKIEYYRFLLLDECPEVHALAVEAHAALAEPEPEGPTRQFVNDRVATILAQREEILSAFIAKHGFDPESAIQVEQRQEDGTTTWRIEARTTPQPVPVSERLPGPGDCIPHPRTKLGKWCWGFERCEVSLARPARWRLMHLETIELEASHWCEAHALPLPNNTSRSI